MTRERDGGKTIDLSSSLSHFFGQAVDEAMRSHGYEATHAAEHYLVGLLADYARPNQLSGETLCRPLTLLLAEALESSGPERFARHRSRGENGVRHLGVPSKGRAASQREFGLWGLAPLDLGIATTQPFLVGQVVIKASSTA